MLKLINNKLGIITPPEINIETNDYRMALKQIGEKLGKLPTLVFDTERGHGECVETVRNVVKGLTIHAKCIIILNEANAVLRFGDDPGREEFLYVDELSFEETDNYLKKLNVIFDNKKLIQLKLDLNHAKDEKLKDHIKKVILQEEAKLTNEDINKIRDTIGTKVIDLLNLAGDIKDFIRDELNENHTKFNLDGYISNILDVATRELKQFPLKDILKELQQHPQGVDANVFGNKKYDGITLSIPIQVGTVMKHNNVLVYRIESGEYQLQSQALKTALKQMKFNE